MKNLEDDSTVSHAAGFHFSPSSVRVAPGLLAKGERARDESRLIIGGVMLRDHVIKFCRLRLGAKPIVDYAQSRRKLLGVTDLAIRTVFDVGANVGKKARHYRKLFPEARIYCFEPVPATFEKLNRWARQQQGAVEAFNLALGSRSGDTQIHWNRVHSGGSTVLAPMAERRHEYESLSVRMETLDSVARRLDVDDEIFVKIDVEGFDMEVIRGGPGLLARASAVIIEIALGDRPSEGPQFRDFVNELDRLGYLYRGNLSHGYVDGIPRLADAVFIKPRLALRAAA